MTEEPQLARTGAAHVATIAGAAPAVVDVARSMSEGRGEVGS